MHNMDSAVNYNNCISAIYGGTFHNPNGSIYVFVCQEDQEELSPSPTEEPWPKKFPEPLSWRSDEEDEDSDFGEEQRDRYLKVLFSNTE